MTFLIPPEIRLKVLSAEAEPNADRKAIKTMMIGVFFII